jgi:small subunit ribosomal protein S21
VGINVHAVGGLDRALKLLQRNGVVAEVKHRRHYLSPGERRRAKQRAALRRKRKIERRRQRHAAARWEAR